MLSNGNKTIPQWYGCKNKNTLKRTKIKSMNTDAASMLKIKKPKISHKPFDGFNNIKDMSNNDGGQGGARGCEAHEVK